jgi:hypothetical protein
MQRVQRVVKRVKRIASTPPDNIDDWKYSKEEMDEFERDVIECVKRDIAENYEPKWRKENLNWVWIDPEPTWMSYVGWDVTIFEWFSTDDPSLKPFKRRFRFSMIGGGQILVTDYYRWFQYRDKKGAIFRHFWKEDPQLSIVTDVAGDLKRYKAFIDGPVYEMSAEAVIGHAPLEVLENVAKTIRAIDNSKENFNALLSRRNHCQFCNRPLKDHVSKLLMMGPDCAKRWNFQHSIKVADAVLKKRKELLGENYKDIDVRE